MLTCRDISVGYSKERVVLRDISLQLEPGRITALLGPNGCGKTTLLRALLGCVVPMAGSIEFGGGAIARMSATTRATHIAYAPQNPSPAPGFSALEVLNFAATALPLAARDPLAPHRETVIEALDLGRLLADPFDQLSAGQRQRISLGRAILQLLASPAAPTEKVLLADEPGSAMDPQHLLGAEALLKGLVQSGMAILVVLHDLLAAKRLADWVILLDSSGSLRGQGCANELLTPEHLSPIFQSCFVPTPYGPILLGAQE